MTATAVEERTAEAPASVEPCSAIMERPYGEPCGLPATTQALFSCFHEHMTQQPLCDRCMAYAKANRAYCVQCYAVGYGHRCVLSIIELPL